MTSMDSHCHSVFALALAFAVFARAESSADESPAGARPPLKDPTILLVRDAAIRAELAMAPERAAAIDALLKKHNDALLAIRDVGPTGADETVQPALAEIRDELKKLFTEEQRTRLQGLILQAQGYDALLRDDLAKQFGFTPEQRTQLTDVMDDFWTQSQVLQKPGEPRPPEELKAEVEKLQAERHRRVLAQLNDRQEKLWSEILGSPFDFSVVKASPALAPEFDDVEEWVNSSPLTLESLRGQVVVIHFFAFGCINCIHNYPWYREWYDELNGKGVTIIGIHTPETQTEADNELLRQSMAERELKFPVAVDKSKKNWQAWHNNIWPSVYIIDKQGRLRYWWYGELDWQGAGGQKIARERIDQLLAEPAPAVER